MRHRVYIGLGVLAFATVLGYLGSREHGAHEATNDVSGASSPLAPSAAATAPVGTPPTDVGALPPDAVETTPGLYYRRLSPPVGGRHPNTVETVELYFACWHADGELVDSHLPPSEPYQVRVDRTVQGWLRSLIEMSPGERRLIWMAPEMTSRGEQKPASAELICDIQLVAVVGGQDPPEDVAAAPDDAHHEPSGLAWKVLSEGDGGESPSEESWVVFRAPTWTPRGYFLPYVVGAEEPTSLWYSAVPRAWRSSLSGMTHGESRRLWIPQSMSGTGPGGIPLGLIVTDLELIDFFLPVPAPPDAFEVPPDARREGSGLATRILREGTGDTRPLPPDTVRVRFTAWSPTGEMLDTTLGRTEGVDLLLRSAAPGWREALLMMVEGERRRVWIPRSLLGVTGGSSDLGAVVDLELVQIRR